MKNLKLIMISLLTWSLIYTPGIFAATPIGKADLEYAVKAYSDIGTDVNSVLIHLEKAKFSRIEELKELVVKGNLSGSNKLPKIVLKNSAIEIIFGKEHLTMTPFRNGEISISFNEKTILINKAASFQKISDELRTFLTNSEKVTFIEKIIDTFIISKTNASLILEVIALGASSTFAIVVLLVAFFAYFIWDSVHTEAKDIPYFYNICDDLNAYQTLFPVEEEEVKRSLASLRKMGKECEKNPKPVCADLKKTINCFEVLSERSKRVNQGNKAAKPVVDPARGAIAPTPAASAAKR